MKTKRHPAGSSKTTRRVVLLGVSIVLFTTAIALTGQIAFAANSAPSTGNVTRYEETDKRLSYSGKWRSSSSRNYSGRALKYAAASGSSVSISFNGTGLVWFATTGPAYGKALVAVDGGSAVWVDLYSPQTRYQQSVYQTGPLPGGTHTVFIEWTGQRNPASLSSYIDVDAVDVMTTTVTAAGLPPAATSVASDTTTTALVTTTTAAQPTTTTVAQSTTTTAPTSTTTTTAAAPATTTTAVAPATTTTTAPTTAVATADAFDLQRAIDAAGPGTTITIPAGTYTGPFLIAGKSNLTLVGPAAAVLTATGADVLRIDNSSGIVLEGFTVVGDYSLAVQKGIYASGLTGGAFRNLTIRDCGNTGLYSNGVFTDIVISGCVVYHCGDFGIHFQNGGNRVLVENCVCYDFASRLYPGHGIYAKTSANVTIRNSECYGVAHLSGNGDGGIQVAYCQGVNIIDCYAHENAQFGFVIEDSQATLTSCRGAINKAADFYAFYSQPTYIGCTGTTKSYGG